MTTLDSMLKGRDIIFLTKVSMIKALVLPVVTYGCILSPYSFNCYVEYIIRNTGLEETQAGIKIAGRNMNNLRFAR